jgi:excisionase family DNA binding protein
MDEASSSEAVMVSAQTDEDSQRFSSEVLTPEQAARLLVVSTRTLERYVENSLVPYIRFRNGRCRGKVRFLRSELLKWMRQQQVRPVRWRGQGRIE